MADLRIGLRDKLKRRPFRKAYVRESNVHWIARQIRVIRESRNMTQADLANRIGVAQSNVARLEDPDYGNYTLRTLLDVADALDVFLSVQFVSFNEGLRRTRDKSVEALDVHPFEAAATKEGAEP